MDTLEFTSDWLESRHINYAYDHRADVVSFMYRGIRLVAFYIRKYNLYVVSHSEKMLHDVLSQKETDAIIGVLQNSTYARPVPREDLHRVKFKVVSGQIPENITRWLDTAANDISDAVLSYRSYLSYNPNSPNSIKQ